MNQAVRSRAIKKLGLAAVAAVLSIIALVSIIMHVGSSTGLDMQAKIWYYQGFIVAALIFSFAFYKDFIEHHYHRSFSWIVICSPMMVVSIWAGLWPAMETWAFSGPGPLWMYRDSGSEIPVHWWGTQIFRYAVVLSILVGGYAAIYRRWVRN